MADCRLTKQEAMIGNEFSTANCILLLHWFRVREKTSYVTDKLTYQTTNYLTDGLTNWQSNKLSN